jgi:hypothetical protein
LGEVVGICGIRKRQPKKPFTLGAACAITLGSFPTSFAPGLNGMDVPR